MATRGKSNRRQWERDYLCTVEISAPPHGHGRRLDAMHDWCKTHSRDWQVFGSTFYFKTEEEAEAFRRTWEQG